MNHANEPTSGMSTTTRNHPDRGNTRTPTSSRHNTSINPAASPNTIKAATTTAYGMAGVPTIIKYVPTGFPSPPPLTNRHSFTE